MRVSERHPDSGRTAIIADEGDSVWLYLTDPSGEGVTTDCWLMNRIPAPRYAELAERAVGLGKVHRGVRVRASPPHPCTSSMNVSAFRLSTTWRSAS
jgi:hypothetical protein